MTEPPNERPRGRPPGPPQPNMARELIGSIVGAVIGAVIAQVVSGEKEVIVSGAIAGSFVGPGLLAAVRRALRSRAGQRERS
jgi:uncharacterized protein YcfJ